MLNPLATNKPELNKRLRESLEQLRGFKQRRVNAHAAEFKAWWQRTHRTLADLFGPTQYLRQFAGLQFCEPRVFVQRGPRAEPEWLPLDQARFDKDFVVAETLLVDAVADSDEPQRQAAEASLRLDSWSRVRPLLHEKIVSVAEERFKAQQYADAAESAIKAINVRIKAAWLAAGKEEKDGKGLMMSALSMNAPVVVLGDTSTMTGRDTQEGYMHLFAGAIQAIRNPKAHEFVTIKPERACQFLVFASLLMQRLDEAGVP